MTIQPITAQVAKAIADVVDNAVRQNVPTESVLMAIAVVQSRISAAGANAIFPKPPPGPDIKAIEAERQAWGYKF